MKRISAGIIVCFIISWCCLVSGANALPQKRIPARAAIVLDPTGAVLFSKFADTKLAPASTVKLMTAMVALDRLKPEDLVRVGRNAASTHSVKPRLRPEDEITVSDLLHLALIKSVNSSAVALAEASAGSERDFVTLMNAKAREIGANNTLFANASGLPDPNGVQYTTVSDLTLILKTALSYPLIREIVGKKDYVVRTAAGRLLPVESTNHLLGQMENMIGGKTGYTGTAQHCFVGAINTDKGTCFTAVLGARSRSSLWRSTMLLADISAKPELASTTVIEKPRAATKRSGHRARKRTINRSRDLAHTS